MKIWVLIPAYNEEKAIGSLLEHLKKKNLSLLVVDDGSSDDTYQIAKKNRADVVLRNDKNLGKGYSLRKGIIYLLNNVDFDYLITMDADNQHSTFDVDSFIQCAKEGCAFAVGNRMHHPYSMPFIRVLTNRFMSFIISLITKQNIPDSQCGFRIIRRDVLEKINIETEKFEIESEILIKAARNNFIIKSIPIRSIYFKNHISKVHPVYDTLRFIRFITHIKK